MVGDGSGEEVGVRGVPVASRLATGEWVGAGAVVALGGAECEARLSEAGVGVAAGATVAMGVGEEGVEGERRALHPRITSIAAMAGIATLWIRLVSVIIARFPGFL